MAQEIADSKLIDTWASSGLIVEPDISKIIDGWQLGEQPPHEYMNWLQNTFGSKLNHILKNGVASWNNTTQYLTGSSVQHNGNVWLCKTTNTNSAPTDANAYWKRIITVESLTTALGGYVANSGDETIAGVKTFSSNPISTASQSTAINALTRKDYVDGLINDRIGLIDYGYVAKPYHIVAFGGEFNRADYPKLWAYLQANPSLVKTQAEWQDEVIINDGICGFYSTGNGTTTFRVPNLDKAFLRPDSRSVGSYQYDAFQGHYHSIFATNTTHFMPGGSAGAYTPTGYEGAVVEPISDGTNGTPRTATETRPKNIAVLPLIVAK